MEHMIENLKNPFEEMYHWCKGEIYDLKSLLEAFQVREAFEKQQKKLEEKKRNTKTDLENVNMRKKTIRTMFKNENDATAMLTAIENVSAPVFNRSFSRREKSRTCTRSQTSSRYTWASRLSRSSRRRKR